MKAQNFGKYINVYYDLDKAQERHYKSKTLINWSAIGSVPPQDAQEFYLCLQRAINYAITTNTILKNK